MGVMRRRHARRSRSRMSEWYTLSSLAACDAVSVAALFLGRVTGSAETWPAQCKMDQREESPWTRAPPRRFDEHVEQAYNVLHYLQQYRNHSSARLTILRTYPLARTF